MDETQDTELDVNSLMRQIRAELAAAGPAPGERGEGHLDNVWATASDAGHGQVRLTRIGDGAAGPLDRKPQYHLGDFLARHDEDFIRTVYRAILGREPDAEGASRYLESLRSGAFSKSEIVGRIRYSPEGRAKGIPVHGLTGPFALRTLRRVPVLGYLIGIAQYVLRLPSLVRNAERLEAVVFQHRGELRRVVDRLEGEIETAFDGVAQRTHSVDEQLRRADERGAQERRALIQRIERDKAGIDALIEHGSARLEVAERAMGTRLDELVAAIAGLEGRKADQQQTDAAMERVARHVEDARGRVLALENWTASQPNADQLVNDVRRIDTAFALLQEQLRSWQKELREQQRSLANLFDALRRGPAAPLTAEQRNVVEREHDHQFDQMYVDFEEQFRGTRENIRNRVSVYLPYLQAAGAGMATSPILDIGSGRGELLELLRDNRLSAHGVDVNRVLAGQCRERGLSVVEGEALTYLRSLDSGSLGGITAIHVVEHLPFKQVVALLDEALRVLRPGGLVVFETPNPENVVVGACNFFYDPTHVRPLPPDLLRFVVSHRGYSDVEVLRLHPRHDAPAREPGARALDDEASRRFFGDQDYAVIGYKRDIG